jgi:hypothetical protein
MTGTSLVVVVVEASIRWPACKSRNEKWRRRIKLACLKLECKMGDGDVHMQVGGRPTLKDYKIGAFENDCS